MSDNVKKGDEVEWSSHGGTARGKVEKKITSDIEEAGRKVRTSADDPQYVVGSEKSGGAAVHKPDALRKQGRGLRAPPSRATTVRGRV